MRCVPWSAMRKLSENSLKVMREKWLKPGEAPRQIYHRVADAVGKNEGDRKTYFRLLSNGYFYPNSPCWTNAGTEMQNLSACYVLPIEDDMGKIDGGIFDTLRNAALIQQAGGGIGYNFSRLRPKGAPVRSSGGVASGPVGFLRVYDAAFEEIKQGGVRRGANLAIMSIDHPDVVEFIACKADEGDLTNFNISVGLTDYFMEWGKDEYWPMDFSSAYSDAFFIKRSEILDAITACIIGNGEPGIVFLDSINRDNLFTERYEATNPCGEMPLLPYESCNLGHIDLRNYCCYGSGGQPGVDWHLMSAHIRIAIMFLDDVIDANHFIPAIPQLRDAAVAARRVGLGFMGLADMLYHLRIRYGSDRGIDFAYRLMEFIRYEAMMASIHIARDRGPFPLFSESAYARAWRPPTRPDWLEEMDVPHPPRPNWLNVINGIKCNGIRNAVTTAIAPTGTTGTVAGVEGYGCEPVYSLSYNRTIINSDGTESDLSYCSPSLEKALRSEKIELPTGFSGSVANMHGIPDWIQDTFVTALDLTIEEHIKMQAAIQVFNDSAISKTINCPADTAFGDIEDAIHLAWELGCKGVTFYVDGSRRKTVLSHSCSECGNKLVFSEGCQRCESCGHSACSI